MICMTTISDDSLIQKFKVDHVILQKIIKLQNVEIFIDMTWAENAITIHMSENDEQLSSFHKDVQENCFASYLNCFLFNRFMTNDYFHQMFKKQYCIILILNNIISKIWYRNEVLFKIDMILHSNIILATAVLNIFCNIAAFIAFINVNSKINVIDIIKFKQNDIEVEIEFRLIVDYIKTEIFSINILLLILYLTQIALLKKKLMSDLQMKNVKTCMIDVYQEEEKLMIIFMMIEDTKIEFQFLSDHFLVECSHSRNSFVVIVNWLNLQVDYSKRLHLLNELKVEFETVETYIDYNKSSTDLDFMIIKHQLRDDLNVETVIIDDVAEKQNSITSFADNTTHDNAWDFTSSEESKTADDNEWNYLSFQDDSNSNFSLKKSLDKSTEVNQSQVNW